MTLDDFLKTAWNDHAGDPKSVAARLKEGAALLETNEQIPPLAQLATHVYGEHLGSWGGGIAFLKSLREHKAFVPESESDRAIARSMAALQLAEGSEGSLTKFSVSDRIRIFAMAAAALSEQSQPYRAQGYFREALENAALGLTADDPANRALAVAANNLACALEERDSRSSSEAALMLLAADTARKYWEITGTWREVMWAEYRLAMSHLKAADLSHALAHAEIFLESARKNQAPAFALFSGFEALTLVEHARGNSQESYQALAQAKEQYALLAEDDKKWCEPNLRKLENLA